MTSPKPITLEEIAAIREAIMRRVPPFNDYPEGAPIRLIRVDELDALAALSPAAQVPREPSQAMYLAGQRTLIDCGNNVAEAWANAAHCWRAMYDAALAERGQDRSESAGAQAGYFAISPGSADQVPADPMPDPVPIQGRSGAQGDAGSASDPTDQSEGGDALASECRLSRSDSSGSGNVVPGERASDQHAPATPESGIVGEIDNLLKHCGRGNVLVEALIRARDEIARLQRWVDAYHAREDRIASLEAEVAGQQACIHSHDEDMRRIAELEAEVARLTDAYRHSVRSEESCVEELKELRAELARAKPAIEMARESAEDADDGYLSPFVQSRLMRLREAISAYDKERE